MLSRRIIAPTRVLRASPLDAHTAPEAASASERIDRNFRMSKTFPSTPVRCWRNRTGLPDSTYTAIAATSITAQKVKVQRLRA